MKFNFETLKNGRIFNVTFLKANGDVRRFNARLGVKINLKGTGLKYSPEQLGNLIVYSMDDQGYRTIKKSNILRIKANGEVYERV